MTHAIVHADLLGYLRGNRWLVQNGYIPKAHAILCDPPYALPGGFMSKDWDAFHSPQAFEAWVSEWAGLLIDYVYPGAVGLFFGGTRTYHRLAAGLEDSGWEIADCLMWVYGSGFPKSAAIDKLLDKRPGIGGFNDFAKALAQAREKAGLTRAQVSEFVVGTPSGACWNWEHHQFPEYRHWSKLKACLPSLDERWGELLAEAEREIVGRNERTAGWFTAQDGHDLTAPATPLAARWEGYGTAMKPAWEPCVVARAPRGKRTYAALAREFGTGALAIDAARIGTDERPHIQNTASLPSNGIYGEGHNGSRYLGTTNVGRWPANFALVCACESDDHDPTCPVAVLGAQSGELRGGEYPKIRNDTPNIAMSGRNYARVSPSRIVLEPGTAARFFYQAKAAAWEREAGLHDRTRKIVNDGRNTPIDNPFQRGDTLRLNVHPTVKPIRLAEYLARLILPPELDEPRRLLVPFAGSGSEMIGALLAGWDVVTGIEREAEYVDLARARVGWWAQFATYDEARAAYEKERKAKPVIIPAPIVVVEDKPAQLGLFDEEVAS